MTLPKKHERFHWHHCLPRPPRRVHYSLHIMGCVSVDSTQRWIKNLRETRAGAILNIYGHSMLLLFPKQGTVIVYREFTCY